MRIPAFSRLAIPRHFQSIVLGNKFPIRIETRKICLGGGVPLLQQRRVDTFGLGRCRMTGLRPCSRYRHEQHQGSPKDKEACSHVPFFQRCITSAKTPARMLTVASAADSRFAWSHREWQDYGFLRGFSALPAGAGPNMGSYTSRSAEAGQSL